jgi:hypothetical protein
MSATPFWCFAIICKDQVEIARMLSLTLREFLIVGWAVPTKYRWFHLLKQLSSKVANHHNGSELIIFKSSYFNYQRKIYKPE